MTTHWWECYWSIDFISKRKIAYRYTRIRVASRPISSHKICCQIHLPSHFIIENFCSSTKVDAIRFKKYFGYMIKSNRSKIVFESMGASMVVVEHFFDNHEFCDERWCKPLKQKEGGKRSLVNHFIVKKMVLSFTNKYRRYRHHSQHMNNAKNLSTPFIHNKTRQWMHLFQNMPLKRKRMVWPSHLPIVSSLLLG